jgi:hypothetical protein
MFSQENDGKLFQKKEKVEKQKSPKSNFTKKVKKRKETKNSKIRFCKKRTGKKRKKHSIKRWF